MTLAKVEQPAESQTEEAVVETNGKVSEPDFKALYEQEQALTQKLENDAKSRDGRLRGQNELLGEIQGLKASVEVGAKVNEAMWKASRAGDEESFESEPNRIRAEAAQGQSQARVEAQYDSLRESLYAMFSGEDGGLDMKTSPELEDIRQGWDTSIAEANASGDLFPFYGLLTQAHTIKSDHQTKVWQQRLDTEKAAKREVRKNTIDELEANDLDLGEGAGGGGEKPWSEMDAVGKMEYGIKQRKQRQGAAS